MKNSKITKEQIMTAAAKVFNEKGFENATVDDIAKSAGVAKGSIYTHFKSRDDILTESIRYIAKERVTELGKLISEEKNSKRKLEILMTANHMMAQRAPEVFLMNYALLLSTHETIKKKTATEFFSAYVDMFEEIIQQGIEKKEFKKQDARLMALTLILAHDLINIIGNIDSELVKVENIQEKLLSILIN